MSRLTLSAALLGLMVACSPPTTGNDGGVDGGPGGGAGGAGGGTGGDGGGSEDNSPPVVIGTTPNAGATMVALRAPITVEFSEPILQSSLVVSSSPSGAFEAAVFSSMDATVSLTPMVDRAPNTLYTITVNASDVAGNALAMELSFSFTTASAVDATPPSVISTAPANAATNVAPAGLVVSVTFSEAITEQSLVAVVNGGAFDLGEPVLTTANTVATWSMPKTPDGGVGSFAAGTAYTLRISAGDIAGNAMPTAHVFSFTTATPPDTTPPTVTSFFPSNDANMVPRNSALVANFSEPMARSLVEANLRVNGAVRAGAYAWNGAGTSVRFTPTTQWATGNYVITLAPGVTDLAGNALPAITTNFTVVSMLDSMAPTATSTPADNATGVPTFSSCVFRTPTGVSVSFNEAMDPVSTEEAFSIESPVGTAVPGVLSWSANGRVLRFNPTQPFGYNTTYVVKVNGASTSARDLAANPLANMTFDFRTMRLLTYTIGVTRTQSGRLLSGAVSGQQQVLLNTSIRAGEYNATVQMRGVASFPISTVVPATAFCVTRAEMTVDQVGITGAPYPSLGATQLELVDMGTVDAADYAATRVSGSAAVKVTDTATPGPRVLDVTSLVRRVLAASTPDNVRFRLSFSTATSSNASVDNAYFENTLNNPVIRATVEVP